MAIDLTTDIGIYFADTYASIQACHDAMPATGGIMIIKPGEHTISSQINVTKPVKFVGAGCADAQQTTAVTKLKTTSTTLVMFNVTAHNVTFEGIAFEGSSSATAGSAIKFTTATGSVPVRGFRIRDCSFFYFYDQVDVVDSFHWLIDGCYFYQPKHNSLNVGCASIPDAGDSMLSNCWFNAAIGGSNYAIYQVHGGGMKVSNCKFNGDTGGANTYAYHYYANIASTTTIALFTGCSFEGFGTGAIYATGAFSQIGVTGCQFSAYTGADVYYIDINGPDGVSISGNVFRCWTGSEKAVRLQNVDYYLVKPNTFWNLNGQTMITTVSCTNEMVIT